MDAIRRRASGALATLFGASGLTHLLRPKTFDQLIPKWVPHPRGVIYASGVAELTCAVGLVTKTRWARAASLLLLVAVFPGNIQMAMTARRERQDCVTWSQVITLARLPLQLVLIWAALQSERSREAVGPTKFAIPSAQSPAGRDAANSRNSIITN